LHLFGWFIWIDYSFVIFVCASDRMEQLGLPLDGFKWNLIFESASKTCREEPSFNKLWQELQPVLYMKTDICIFMIISLSVLLRIRNVSDKNCRENQNTHFMFDTFFRKSCCLWHSVKTYGKARQATESNITRRMRIACSINKATNTYSEYVLLNVFTRQQWLGERVSNLLYTNIVCLG
jgi:hypothetical protein